MLTLSEVLSDVAASPGFEDVAAVAPDSRGRNGETPLHWMATLGDDKGVLLLLNAGANINAQDNGGNTPLHRAISDRQVSAAQALLTAGADRALTNIEGLTPKGLADADGYAPAIALFADDA